jgi:phosphatidylinositol dimannoside acyltransferase
MSVPNCAPDVNTRDAATEWAFSTGWRIVKQLPEPAARRLFDSVADQLWKRRGPSVQQLERNLARVDPSWSPEQLREVSREGMRSYLRYWQEAFRLPAWKIERIRDGFGLDPESTLDDAMREGGGVIMVPSHSANWDHAGAWACVRYGGVSTVAERLKPAGLFEQFLEYRRSLGMDVLALGDDDIVRQLVRRLREGRIVALLGDRDISRSGVEVNLLGEPARLPAGPALLSIMTGAPLHPVAMRFTEDGSRGDVAAKVEVPHGLPRSEQITVMTQQIADALGEGIRRSPQDWHMLQPVWVADLDPARTRAAAREGVR